MNDSLSIFLLCVSIGNTRVWLTRACDRVMWPGCSQWSWWGRGYDTCHITQKPQSLLSWSLSSAENVKEQLYPWLLRSSDTGDSFYKMFNKHLTENFTTSMLGFFFLCKNNNTVLICLLLVVAYVAYHSNKFLDKNKQKTIMYQSECKPEIK